MGFDFMDIIDPTGTISGEGSVESIANPAGQLAEKYSGDSTISFLLDPMDLFGNRAEDTAAAIKDILTRSAEEGIAQQEEQEAFLKERYQPYYQAATEEALPGLESMVLGGEMDYTPSKLYEYQKKQGLANIRAGAAKGGLLHSSAAQQSKAEFLGGLASEEAGRAYSDRLSQLQLGTGAAEAVSAAGTQISQNIGSLYSGLASGLNATTQAYGQARQASWSSAGNTLTSLSGFMGQK